MLRTVFLLLGAAFFALLLWYLGPSEIVELLRRIGWSSIAILLLYAAHHATRALALSWCVLQRGVVGYRDALAIRLSGEAIQLLTFTGPLLAEPTRAWLLERHGLTLKEGFAATITEYLTARSSQRGCRLSASSISFGASSHPWSSQQSRSASRPSWPRFSWLPPSPSRAASI